MFLLECIVGLCIVKVYLRCNLCGIKIIYNAIYIYIYIYIYIQLDKKIK